MTESNSALKMETRGLDFYYGSNHALKNINIVIRERQITCLDRAFWMWKIYFS